MPDIFEKVLEKRKRDIFVSVKEKADAEKAIEDAISKSNKEVLASVKAYVKANKYVPPPPPPKIDVEKEVSKVIPKYQSDTLEEVKKEINKIKLDILNTIQIPVIPEKVIEKHTEKVIEKPIQITREINKYDEQVIEDLKSEIEALKKKLADVENVGPVFIPAPPIVPSWSGQSGKILTNNGDQLSWRSYDATDGYFYIGDRNVDGCWRLYNDGTNLLAQRLESGTWTEKGAFLA